MITSRDIKVFIFSLFITTLCLALFNQPIKQAEAQGEGGGGMLVNCATSDRLENHASGAVAKHGETHELLQNHINGAVAKHGEMHELLQNHINGAVAKHGEMLEILGELRAALSK